MKFDYKAAGIYASATHAYRAIFSTVIFFSVMLVLLEFLQGLLDAGSSHTIMSTIVKFWFAFFMHQAVLTGETVSMWKANSFGGSEFRKFFWRCLLLSLLIIFLMIPFFIYLISVDTPSGDSVYLLVLIYFVVFVLPIYGVFLTFFGTILPAAVAGDRASFRAAYQRSRGQFRRTLFRLLYGPAFAYLVVFAIAIALSVTGLPLDVFDGDRKFNLLGMVIAFLFYVIAFYPATLAVVVLCKAYLNTTPPTDNT